MPQLCCLLKDRTVLINADNSHHIAFLAEEANAMREGLSRALNGHLTLKIEEAVHMSETLGASIDLNGGVVAFIAARLYQRRSVLGRIIRGRLFIS